MRAERLTILHEIHREMERYPDGYGLHQRDLAQRLGGLGKLDLYYLEDKGLIYRKTNYLKLSAAGLDIVEEGI